MCHKMPFRFLSNHHNLALKSFCWQHEQCEKADLYSKQEEKSFQKILGKAIYELLKMTETLVAKTCL